METTMDSATGKEMNAQMFKSRLMEVLNEANLHQLEERMTLRLVDFKTGDEAELSSIDKDKQFDLRLRSRQVTYIKKVKEAIRRIDEGTFGTCMECDGDISLSRLQARPTAHLCISCKEEQERGEHQIYEGEGSSLLKKVIEFKFSDENKKDNVMIDHHFYETAGSF
ncbi:MAG: TraR/DksA family transcriptional regulator [Bacteriovoracaceae bacterium]